MQWDKHKKPPESICPETFCFFWSESDQKCREAFGQCCRSNGNLNNNNKDWYEPCEPELERYGLPWFYFITNEKGLSDDLKKEYLSETRKLWKNS